MAEPSDDRIHPATPQRRRQAREQGNVARSPDLTSSIVLLCGVAALGWFGAGVFGQLATNLHDQLGARAWLTLNMHDLTAHVARLFSGLATTLLPILIVLVGTAAMSHLSQSGFLLFPQRAVFDLQRVNPADGLARMLSLDRAVRTVFGLVKLTAVAALTMWCGLTNQEAILGATGAELPALGIALGTVVFRTCLKIGGLLLALGAADFGYQWWRRERSLRMTTEELREELRSENGDPQIAARRRRLRQHALAAPTPGVSRVEG